MNWRIEAHHFKGVPMVGFNDTESTIRFFIEELIIGSHPLADKIKIDWRNLDKIVLRPITEETEDDEMILEGDHQLTVSEFLNWIDWCQAGKPDQTEEEHNESWKEY